MASVWGYSLASVAIVSLLSLIGVFTLSFSEKKLKNFLIYFVSFSAGALFGDVFIHLLPEAVEEFGFTIELSLFLLAGIIASFLLEKVVHWQHCHMPITKSHVHRFAYMNLFGDMVHNFIDGIIIGAAYLVSIPVGIATTIAVILHEIPQEIGDFGVLLHGGFSKMKAIGYNFLTALTAIAGTIVALTISQQIENVNMFLIPFAAGSFIYIAGSDLIPELHKEEKTVNNMFQVIAFALGIFVMYLLLGLE
jgi:zinc and cadmium transporter